MKSLQSSLKDKVFLTIERFEMILPGDLVMVAVSGGVDSVVLLNILLELKADLGIELCLFHLDHMLRGEESKADAKFVQDLAKGKGLAIETCEFDVAAFAKERGLSIEEAAREVRYNFMTKAAQKMGAQKVALGHSADDRVETFFINLIRGSGLKGLSSIGPKRGIFIRPLIEILRRDIEAYAKERGLRFRLDLSNLDQTFLRNRVRAELIPLLETYNPNLKEVILGNIEVIMGDEALLSELAKIEFERLAVLSEGMAALPFAAAKELKKPIRSRVIRLAVELVKGDLKAIEKDHIEGMFDLKEGILRRDLPWGVVIMKEGENLIIIEKGLLAPAEKVEFELKAEDGALATGLDFEFKSSIIEFAKGSLSLLAVAREESKAKSEIPLAHLDADLLEKSLVIRNWRFGDRFRPLNMAGFKKLSDFFVDIKLARRLRDRVPIVTSGGEIIWVVGLRLDDRFKITDNTKRMLRIEAIPKGQKGGRQNAG
ncbi:MAG: tRNA lysidine(34) synthetase TilS [Actinomycetota bacterium]|nr:tRNA lysidine(34) synthetase TilS [Actinomycetota bacterium]